MQMRNQNTVERTVYVTEIEYSIGGKKHVEIETGVYSIRAAGIMLRKRGLQNPRVSKCTIKTTRKSMPMSEYSKRAETLFEKVSKVEINGEA